MHLLPSNCLPLSATAASASLSCPAACSCSLPLSLVCRGRVSSLPRSPWDSPPSPTPAPLVKRRAGHCRAQCAAEERRGDCGLPFRRCRFAPRRRRPSVPRRGLVSFYRSRASWPRCWGSHSQLRKLSGLSECCPYPCCAGRAGTGCGICGSAVRPLAGRSFLTLPQYYSYRAVAVLLLTRPFSPMTARRGSQRY